MSKGKVEPECERHIADKRDKAEQFAQVIAVIELAHPGGGNQKADHDVEKRECESFDCAAQISEFAPLRQKEPVEKHFENKKGEKNSNLDGQIPSRCPMRGSLQPVAPPELIMLQLQVAQMTAQAVQLVSALGRFRAEFGYGRRCSLPDRAKPPLEVEAREALLIRAQLVEKQAVGRVLFGLHALEDAVFDLVEDNAVRRRLLAGAAVGSKRRQPHVIGKLVDVQRRE